MLSIGAFAQIGQVSHRMLRHWDAAGLLVPAHVDARTGYRSYDPSQLARLHRIVALRQLGFGLDDIALALEDGIGPDRLTALLRERRAEVEREHELAAARLADVERRLHLIEKERSMTRIDVVEKPLPAVRLAARSAAVSEGSEFVGVVGDLFDGVAALVGEVCGALETPIAYYEMEGPAPRVTAGYEYSGEPRAEFEIVELPAVERAICGVHLGPVAGIGATWQAIHAEIQARGLHPSGPNRELYVRAESDDQQDWVIELQQPVSPAQRRPGSGMRSTRGRASLVP